MSILQEMIKLIPRPALNESSDDRYYTTSAVDFKTKLKERFGETTRSTDKDGRWIYKNKNGRQVGLSDIDGEGDRTFNVFSSSTITEAPRTHRVPQGTFGTKPTNAKSDSSVKVTKTEYPVIDDEHGTRLFDKDLVKAIIADHKKSDHRFNWNKFSQLEQIKLQLDFISAPMSTTPGNFSKAEIALHKRAKELQAQIEHI